VFEGNFGLRGTWRLTALATELRAAGGSEMDCRQLAFQVR
jgi:hypothetical protein